MTPADLAAIRLVLDAFGLYYYQPDDSGESVKYPRRDHWWAELEKRPTCAQVRAALKALEAIERMAEETK